MSERVILQQGRYAIVEQENQYVMACGYNSSMPKNQRWEQGYYFTHWNESEQKKVKCLYNALDLLKEMTEENHIPRPRLEELATKFKDGLLEDNIDSVMDFFEYECEMTESEKEWFGIEETDCFEDRYICPDDDDGSEIGCADCPDDECDGHCMSCSYRPV